MLSEGFMRDFFGLRRSPKKGIDQACPKCGNDMNIMNYRPMFKDIEIGCCQCKHHWTVPALDSQASDAGVKSE